MTLPIPPCRPLLYGLLATGFAGLMALTLPGTFALDPASAAVKWIIGLVLAAAEAVFVIRRAVLRRPNRDEMFRDALSSGVFVLSLTLGLSRWVEYTWNRSTTASDFAQDYLAGYALRNGIEIYGLPLRHLGQQLLQLQMLDNYHPPFNAILFLPFSFLPYRPAFFLWNFFSLLIYVGLILVLLQSLGLLTFRSVRASAVLLLWEPFVSNIFLGQLSLPLSVLTIGGFLLLQANRDGTAGFWFGLATLMKLYPGLIVVYLLSQRRLRCLTVFLAIVAGGFLGTVLLMSGALVQYFRLVVPEQTATYAAYPLNVSISGAVRSIFEPTYFSQPLIWAPRLSDICVWLLDGFVVGSICLFSYCHRSEKFSADLFSLFSVAMLLSSPITWVHNCILLLFPMALLWRDVIVDSSARSARQLLWIVVLCAVPLQESIDGIRAYFGSDQLPWYVTLGVKTAFFGLVFLYGIFWQRLARTAGYVSVWQLFGSLRRRNVRAYFIQ